MTRDQLLALRPGDRLLVNASPANASPPRAMPPAEAVFVSLAEDPSTALPLIVVCGLPDGWDDEHNEPLGLRVLWAKQAIQRLGEPERIERMRHRLVVMAEQVAA